MMIRITLLFVLSLLSTQTLSYTYDTSEYFYLDKNIGSETITPNCDGETDAFKFIDHLWGNSTNKIHLGRFFLQLLVLAMLQRVQERLVKLLQQRQGSCRRSSNMQVILV